MATELCAKRVYEMPVENDGFRILIDRLWPRGLTKEKAKIDLWLKEIAPSSELRKWFNHEPEKWADFRIKYKAEIAKNTEAVNILKNILEEHKIITLVFGAKDEKHNDAVVLLEVFGK